MTAVLGVSALYHDAAAALVVDGEIVVAIQEERLSRVKNDPSLPTRAMRACLAAGGLAAGDLDEIVFYEDPYKKLERSLMSSVRGFPRGLTHFHRSMSSQLGHKVWILDAIAEGLEIDRKKVTCSEHHTSHASSAFFTSGLEHAAILTVDGVGEEAATAIFEGKGRALRCLFEQHFPHSLGLFYAAFTAYCGFRVNDGEQKLMGLAAYGEPRFEAEVGRVMRISDEGEVELSLDYFDAFQDAELGFGPALEELFGPRRTPNRPWRISEPEDRRYADIARSVQEALEGAMLALARKAKRETGATALCLAGGVALNAVANARLLEVFDHVYVHPAAGDAGGALGAALLRDPPRSPRALASAGIGLPPDRGEALTLARELGLHAETVSDPAALAAETIAAGGTVAFVTGKSEWGPRALGHRSLLAPAGPERVKDRIHRTVKEREPFRPFAPAILDERADAVFEGVHRPLSRYMTGVARAHDPSDDHLGAVVHVDGTVRVQTVDEENAPELARVLRALKDRDGSDVILNTSLNAAGEPMVLSALDAVVFAAHRPIDLLLVDDVAVTKPKGTRP